MKHKIKIAVLLPSLQMGGAERLVIDELSYMKNDDRFSFEVHLVFEEGAFFPNFKLLGIPAYVWGGPHKSLRMLKSYANIILHLRRTGCNILHSHLIDNFGPIVGKLSGAKVVATVHNDKRYGLSDRFGLRRSDLVLACGQQVFANICGFLPLEKIDILNNALMRPKVAASHKKEVFKKYGIPERNKLLVSLGRFKWQKGFDVLIEAFRQVRKKTHDVTLVIGGEGEEKDHINELVNSCGLREFVVLPGSVYDINELLASCDIYINSSRWEGLPITLLEAMAHRKPIVATNVGGNPELVRDSETGLLVQPENPEKLASAITQIVNSNDFGRMLGKNGFLLFEKSYGIEQHCKILAEYYMQVIK